MGIFIIYSILSLGVILGTTNCYDVLPLDTQPITFVEPSNMLHQ